MKKNNIYIILTISLGIITLFASCDENPEDTVLNDTLQNDTLSRIADHSIVAELWEGRITESSIQTVKDNLHIAYGHTSHGSQIIDGMNSLVPFANSGNLGRTYSEDLFELDVFEGDGYGSGPLDHDAGYYPDWVNETRAFLDDPAYDEYNVIMWSWCGQVSSKTEQSMIDEYLAPMSAFEEAHPEITFIYMTGHLDGTGVYGNLNKRNEQIRQYCIKNNKWLFDFADIESWGPDGTCYLSLNANDACDYDKGNNTRGNWATEWQESHTEGIDWYNCSSLHSQPLNANMKAYAAWWLFCRIAKEM